MENVRFSLLSQHRSNRLVERWDFVLHDVPDDFRIETEILMNQNVAKPGHFFHSSDGYWSRRSSGSFLTASPITSRFRTTASKVFSSSRNAALERFAV